MSGQHVTWRKAIDIVFEPMMVLSTAARTLLRKLLPAWKPR